MNAWRRFARQKEERTSSALTRRFELRTTRRPIRRSYALHRPASFAPRCAATSLLLRSCTVVLTIKRWDAPRPVSLTRGFKGHTPFIRPVFATASAASCLCHQEANLIWLRFLRLRQRRLCAGRVQSKRLEDASLRQKSGVSLSWLRK